MSDKKIADLESVENAKKPAIKNKPEEESNILDGYVKLERFDLPQEGVFYPENWKFAYKCPSAKEVAIFSALQENDLVGIMNATEELIRKNVVIFDFENKKSISSGEINDFHRQYFLLKLRDFFIVNNPIEIEKTCSDCDKDFKMKLVAENLIFKTPNEKLLEAFDGRNFSLTINEIKINFLIPTLERTGRVFKYLVRAAREEDNTDKKKIFDKTLKDKKFLLLVPFLFETGDETIPNLIDKFNKIVESEDKLKAYVELASNFNFGNSEEFNDTCPHCESLEETQIKFPGGFKKLFVNTKSVGGYFN